jgi:phosphoglycolate phosphatase
VTKRLALFDCDGTLVDSQHNICTAMAKCFSDENISPPTREAILRCVGLSLPEIMRVLLPHEDDALHRHLVAQYRLTFQRMRAAGLPAEPLYDGVADVLDVLHASGWLMGVATGKSDRGLSLCLQSHGIVDRFVTLQTADRHPSKPHPSMAKAAIAEAGATPATTVVIGDTSYDMAMARHAGARAIGVAWGYHPARELHAAGAHAVARHPSELPALLEAK